MTDFELPTLTEVAATRELTGPDGPVVIEIGKPTPFDATKPNGDHYCAFRVKGVEEPAFELFAGGVDGIQAIQLALGMIGSWLDSRNIELTFLEKPGHGLPNINE